jgi:cell division protein FtsN
MPININIEGPEAKNRRLMQEQEQALRLRILDQQYKQSQPGYSAETAGRLGRGLEESERNLQLQDELLADLSKRKQNVAAAATQLQPQVAGPVMPEQAAISAL